MLMKIMINKFLKIHKTDPPHTHTYTHARGEGMVKTISEININRTYTVQRNEHNIYYKERLTYTYLQKYQFVIMLNLKIHMSCFYRYFEEKMTIACILFSWQSLFYSANRLLQKHLCPIVSLNVNAMFVINTHQS